MDNTIEKALHCLQEACAGINKNVSNNQQSAEASTSTNDATQQFKVPLALPFGRKQKKKRQIEKIGGYRVPAKKNRKICRKLYHIDEEMLKDGTEQTKRRIKEAKRAKLAREQKSQEQFQHAQKAAMFDEAISQGQEKDRKIEELNNQVSALKGQLQCVQNELIVQAERGDNANVMFLYENNRMEDDHEEILIGHNDKIIELEGQITDLKDKRVEEVMVMERVVLHEYNARFARQTAKIVEMAVAFQANNKKMKELEEKSDNLEKTNADLKSRVMEYISIFDKERAQNANNCDSNDDDDDDRNEEEASESDGESDQSGDGEDARDQDETISNIDQSIGNVATPIQFELDILGTETVTTTEENTEPIRPDSAAPLTVSEGINSLSDIISIGTPASVHNEEPNDEDVDIINDDRTPCLNDILDVATPQNPGCQEEEVNNTSNLQEYLSLETPRMNSFGDPLLADRFMDEDEDQINSLLL